MDLSTGRLLVVDKATFTLLMVSLTPPLVVRPKAFTLVLPAFQGMIRLGGSAVIKLLRMVVGKMVRVAEALSVLTPMLPVVAMVRLLTIAVRSTLVLGASAISTTNRNFDAL